MPFTSNNAELVFLRTPPKRDNYGDIIPGTGRDIPIPGCLFAPGAGRESEVNMSQVRADGTLLVPPEGPLIEPDQQLVIRGDVYEVISRPRVWLNEGTEVPVRIVTG